MAVKMTLKGKYILKDPKDQCNFSIEELQKLVGGDFELIHLVNTQIIVVNAEKAIRADETEINKTGDIYCIAHKLNRHIYGSFLLCNRNEIDNTLKLMEPPLS